MGSLLLPHFYGFFYVCLGLVALSNPGFHLAQTSGLSQAIFQAYAWGDSIPVLGIGSWAPCGPSFWALLTMPSLPLPVAGPGLTSRSELVS